MGTLSYGESGVGDAYIRWPCFWIKEHVRSYWGFFSDFSEHPFWWGGLEPQTKLFSWMSIWHKNHSSVFVLIT